VQLFSPLDLETIPTNKIENNQGTNIEQNLQARVTELEAQIQNLTEQLEAISELLEDK